MVKRFGCLVLAAIAAAAMVIVPGSRRAVAQSGDYANRGNKVSALPRSIAARAASSSTLLFSSP